ncbi:AMP-binding protein [Ornithinimicrobium faecis]|uniref:AMP-binding protein n=1 Tax=Ornithinimicrobium faecis TaxID=2934158 RepID=UPI002118ABFC|nr:AMP-binding protein [Ornithinimicrobium sp. HY1745]
MNQLSFDQLLQRQVAAAPEAVAVEMADGSGSVTFGELDVQIGRRAAALARIGLGRGDALAMWVPNGVEWLTLFFACARRGVLAVPLNTRYKAPEVRHLLSVSGARTLVIEPGFHDIDFVGMTAEALQQPSAVETVVLVGAPGQARNDAQETFTSLGRSTVVLDTLLLEIEEPLVDEGLGDDAVVVFGTSGTTSFPKLAVHDQAGAHTHILNVAGSMQLDGDDRVLCLLPFCGTYGFVAVMSTLAGGGRAVVLPVFDADEVPQAMDRHGVTCLFAVEAIVRQLVAEEVSGGRTGRFASWRKGGVAGIKIRDLIDLADEVFDCRLVNLYGSSELFAMMATWDLGDEPALRALAGGRVLEPGMYARCVDPVTRHVQPTGESGEFEFFGVHVTKGYLANDEANRQAFTDDGWYVTGDRGRLLDDRTLEYESRLTDTLRLRGYLVSPAEIEDLLADHPQVASVQVVGVPNASTGNDRAVAFVIDRGSPPDPASLRDFCRERAAVWKVPELFVNVTEFPTTPSANGDKVQKGKLRSMAEASLEQALATSTNRDLT